MKFLFWNTYKKQLNSVICDLIVENGVDIAVFAEYCANEGELFQLLASRGVSMRKYDTIGCERIMVIGKTENVVMGRQTEYESIQIINGQLILCCVHLPSQIYTENEERRNTAIQRIMHDIRSTEVEFSTKQTVVVGDLNINPFDYACTGIRYFNAVPIFAEAKKNTRKSADEEFDMFYNPMWNFFGDFQKPYGTCYSSKSSIYWNVFDQVLLRPALRKRFVDTSLQILAGTEHQKFLNRIGHLNKSISDHLPIVFELERM